MRIGIVVIALCLLLGCKPRTRFDNKPPEDGILKTQKKVQQFGKINVEEIYRNGKMVQETGFYKNNNKAYERYLFSETGKESTLTYYNSGRLRSVMVSQSNGTEFSMAEYYENGQLKWRGNNNVPQEKIFYENGQLQSQIIWKNDQVVKKILWYNNGKKKEESHWRNDRLHGYKTVWDSLGNIIFTNLYKDGRKVQ